MRIALVVPWLKIGGVETFLFRLARGFQSVGYEVEIVATRYDGEWFDRARQLGIPAVCLREATSFSRARHAIKVGRYLRSRGFDVCFLNHTREAQASIALLPDNTVVVPIIHNDHEDVYAVGCANRDAWNVVVAVSHKVFSKTKALVHEKPVIEIPYGVELPPIGVLENKDFFSCPLRIVFVGRLTHAQKGILFIPEILASCRQKGLALSVCIIGDGRDRQALLDKAASLQVLDLIDMQGVLPHEEIYAALARAHVLLMPSFYEGHPIVLLEAMACGCVPIVSRLPGITNFVIDDYKDGFLIGVGNIDAFACAIENVYYDRLMLKAMSIASRLTVEKRFSVETMAKAYIKLVNSANRDGLGKFRSRSSIPHLDPSLISLRDHLPLGLQSYYYRLRQNVRSRLIHLKSLMRSLLSLYGY